MANPRMAISNLNAHPAESLRWDAQQYQKLIEDVGADGLLWTNYRKPHNWTGRLAARMALAGKIAGWHQSWQTTRLRDLRPSKGSIGRLPERLMLMASMPGLERSLDDIRHIEDLTAEQRKEWAMQEAEPRSVVIHPNGQHLGNRPPHWHIDYRAERTRGGLGKLLIQPTVEWVASKGGLSENPTITAQNIVDFTHEEGCDGNALDLNHLLAVRGGMRFTDPHGVAVELGRHHADGGAEQIHLGVLPDLGGNLEDLRTIIGLVPGKDIMNTPHGQIMRDVARELPADHDILVAGEVRAATFDDIGVPWRVGNRQLLAAARVALNAP